MPQRLPPLGQIVNKFLDFMLSLIDRPCAKSKVFVAFEPINLAAALSQTNLTPSASDLYVYLHSIAPFGSFYHWSDNDNGRNPTSIRQALKRRSGKYRGTPMGIRTFQLAKKLLVEKGLIFINKKGFRILQLLARKPQAGDQLNLFFDAEKRKFDRVPTLKVLRGGDLSDRKDRISKEINTNKTHQVVCLVEKPKLKAKDSGIVSEPPVSLVKPKSPQKRAKKPYSAAPAFTKLNQQQIDQLAELGVAPQQITHHLVRVIQAHTPEAMQQAVAYTRQRLKRSQILNPVGYFLVALQQGYRSLTLVPTPESTGPTPQQEWLKLAYDLNIMAASRVRNGTLMVYLSDEQQSVVTIDQAFDLYSLEELRQFTASKSCPDLRVPVSSAPSEPEPEPQPDEALTPEQLQSFMLFLAPKDPHDAKRDFRLKLAWFQRRLLEFGPDDRLLQAWEPFRSRCVSLVHDSVGWRLVVAE